MTKKLRGQILLPFVALFLMLAGCSSESPTAPTGGGGGGAGGGGTTPPVGAEVTLSAGNLQPLVSSSSTITAAVRVNGAVAPNGTAVEFTTNLGTFTDTASATSLRTTTDGSASATLTSSTAGVATVTARVNNVSRTIQITFRESTGGGGGTSPTITSFTPATSRPSGGQLVTIRGTNFEAPVRVLFGTTEATVVSVTPTAIQVIVPSINLGATEQTRSVNITIISRAGSASEEKIVSATPFRYEIEILTPMVYTVAPASGPNEGNTRIVILGEGFQAPVRVFFGTAVAPGGLVDQTELEVLQVNFGQIIAMTPPALGLGAPLKDQQVTIRVLNVAGNKEGTLANAFRYGPGIRVIAASPTQGPAVGGTMVTIDGWGFDDPVAVTIGGVAARVIRVSGTQIVAVTSQLAVPCAGGGGDVIVTNIEDGASSADQSETAPTFTYLAQSPLITAVSPTSLGRGGVLSVTVANPGNGNVRFRLGDEVVFATPSVSTDPLGPTTFSITVPADFVFEREACIVGTETGERNVPTRANITFNNVTTGCNDTAERAVSITPTPAESVCEVPVTPGVAAAVPTAQSFGVQAISTTGTRQQQICNTGGSPFDITSVSINGANAPEFGHNAVIPPNVTVAAGACATFNVTFTPTSSGAKTANLSVTTSVGSLNVALTGSAP